MSITNSSISDKRYLDSDLDVEDQTTGEIVQLANQCERYEEQIVELHSVIAELSRNLKIERDQIIPEETESSSGEFHEEDENEEGLFEHELETKLNDRTCPKEPYDEGQESEDDLAKHDEICNSKIQEDEKESNDDSESQYDGGGQDVLYKIELFDQLQQELIEYKQETKQLRESLMSKDEEIKSKTIEREVLKRQLADLQASMEYQEAKMDLQR